MLRSDTFWGQLMLALSRRGPAYVKTMSYDELRAAAQLRMVLDEKLGRETPEVVKRLAESNA